MGGALAGAAANGHLDVAAYLLGLGVNIHTVEDMALYNAIQGRHPAMVEFLLENGADVLARGKYFYNVALHDRLPETVELIEMYMAAHPSNIDKINLYWLGASAFSDRFYSEKQLKIFARGLGLDSAGVSREDLAQDIAERLGAV